MAILSHLEHLPLEIETTHTETVGTYAIVSDNGRKCLQVDTYGSANRQLEGKKSQSMRFTASAIRELRAIIDKHFSR